ncbi:MAG: type II toxin-antitoxin system VapC family toxin [Spirulina sp. SIO3F2]|nr:type II toxin-antitoxin system VapC family toxin [Spirulina sp. SIO3F2]
MSLLLLDTNVASFIFKGSQFAQPYQPLVQGHELALSFMTVTELFQWSVVRNWGDRRIEQLEDYLSNYLIIPVDQPLCWEWAKIRAERQRVGQPISSQDAWVAATARRHELPLITHNGQDFRNIANLHILEPDS